MTTLASTEPPGHRLQAMVKLWPGAAPLRLPSLAETLANDAFDCAFELGNLTSPAAAADRLLTLAASTAGVCRVLASPKSPLPVHEPPGEPWQPVLSAPLSLWRARDGWLMVDLNTRDAWRNFCATFLNRSAYHGYAAGHAWHEAVINRLATDILDTHKVEDAVGTCLTYQIPAAVVAGWRDCEQSIEGAALGQRVAWAAIVPIDKQ